jgi:hypothetical protein
MTESEEQTAQAQRIKDEALAEELEGLIFKT